MINDAPVVFDDRLLENTWRPENDSGKFYGPTRLRKALYLSRNLVSIRILRSIGTKTAIQGLERFGFDTSEFPRDLSLALGSHAVTPLQVATGYAILANGGYRIAPYLIERIEDTKGNVIYQAAPLTVCEHCNSEANIVAENEIGAIKEHNLTVPSKQEDSVEPQAATENENNKTLLLSDNFPVAPRVISPQVAYIIDSILKDVIRKGTGKGARVLKRSDLAGKTGTTNGPKDAWFSGYSSQIAATAWLGFDGNLLLGRREYGGSAALPIWIDFMKDALEGSAETTRPQPEGIVMIRIDPNTGLRVGPEHANAMFEIFRKDQVPPMADKPPNMNNEDGLQNTPRPEDLF